MIEGQEVTESRILIRLISVEGQQTKAVLAQTCMGVFFIRSVSDIIFAMLFLPKPPATAADHRWSADHSLRNTVVCCLCVRSPGVLTALWMFLFGFILLST